MSSLLSPELVEILVDNYKGNFNGRDHFQGYGKCFFKSGNVYEGDLRDGVMQGQGKFIWKGGVTFEGTFHDNKMQGSGVYKWTNGAKYEGEVVNGLRHGFGTLQKTRSINKYDAPLLGLSYVGEWKNGLRDGKGTLKYDASGSQVYEGTWKNNMKHGFGIMKYASGNVYEGEWKNDEKSGNGVMNWFDRKERYTGEWKNGHPCGYGEYVSFRNGGVPDQLPYLNRYKGLFEAGKRSGYGVYEYSTGARYCGMWSENKKHGYGTYITENGRVYEGEFRDDQIVGDNHISIAPELPFWFSLNGLNLYAGEQETIAAINVVILRYISFLRSTYNNYARLSWFKLCDESRAMNRLQLLRVFSDCQIVKTGHLMVDVNRSIAKSFAGHFYHTERYSNPHNHLDEFIFHEFLQALIHVSNYIYQEEDAEHIENQTASNLAKFVRFNMLPCLKFPLVTDKFCHPSVKKELLDTIRLKLYEIYHYKAKSRKTSLPDSVDDRTLTVRDIIIILNEYNMIDKAPFKGLIVKDVLKVFKEILPMIQVEDSYNLEYEVLAEEFLDAMMQLSLYRLNRIRDPSVQVLDITEPKKHEPALAPEALPAIVETVVAPTPATPQAVATPAAAAQPTPAPQSQAAKGAKKPPAKVETPAKQTTKGKADSTKPNDKNKQPTPSNPPAASPAPAPVVEEVVPVAPKVVVPEKSVEEVILDPLDMVNRFFEKLFESFENEKKIQLLNSKP